MIANAQFAKPKKSQWIRSMLPPVLAGVMLIVALTKWFPLAQTFLEPSRNAMFRIEDGAWQPLPELPGQPESLRVSAGGAVWAVFWSVGMGSELARLDGPRWRIYNSADFGTRGLNASGGFVLDGEEVWAVTEKGVLRGDGRYWKLYGEVIGAAGASSMVAANGKAWVIDDKGSLSHFDGSQWKVRRVELPGATWGDKPDEDSPDLARTDDGSLWIVRNGVWRSDGSEWTAVKPGGEDLKDTTLVGTTSEGIWLWDGELLARVGIDGTLHEFEPEEMGFSQREMVREVAERGGRTFVATSLGIVEFDGAAWRRLARPLNGVRAVVGIRAGAGGELFAIGNIPNPGARRWRILVTAMPFVLTLGMLAIPVWMVRRHKRYRLGEHLRLQQTAAHGTGAVPEEFARDERLLAKQSSWWSATLTVGVIVGAMAGYYITRIFWPAAPKWMFLAIALGLHTVSILRQTLVRRTPNPWDPIEPGGASFDWGPTWRALPASLIVFVLMNVGEFPKWMGSPVSWLLYGMLVPGWYKVIEEKFVVWAIRRGDYEGGLKMVRRLHFFNPEGSAALSRSGHILLTAGRFREAEETLRRAVAGLRSGAAQAQALECLGDAMLEQGRDDEALRSYEAALQASPGFRRPYRGMAELELRQRRDPARALEYVENIVGPSGAWWNRWTRNGQVTDDYWSLKAWALAELGRGAEVGPAVAEAIRKTNPKSRPDVSATYRRLGLAMQAMDRQTEAEEYFKKVTDADPQGRWSPLVKGMLKRSLFRV